MIEAITLVSDKDFNKFSLFQAYLKNRVTMIIKIFIYAFFALFMLLILAAVCFAAFFTTIGLQIIFILPFSLIFIFPVVFNEVIRFISAKRQYYSVTSHAPIQYIFNENNFSIYSASPNGTVNGNYSYAALKDVYETKQYFYLYLINNQAFIIDKYTFTKGTAEQLSILLPSILGPKFKKR